MPDRSMTRLYRPLTESLANRLQCTHRETGREEKGGAARKTGGKRRTRAQAKEAAHAKRGAGLWRPEAAPCPREGTHGIAGSRPFASPQEQADAGPSCALHLRRVRHAREALVFGHETAFWHETARPRGTPKTLNRRFADGTPHRQRERGTKGEFSCQNSVSWPKNNRFARTEKRGLLRSCRPNSESRHRPPASPFLQASADIDLDQRAARATSAKPRRASTGKRSPSLSATEPSKRPNAWHRSMPSGSKPA